MSHRPRQKENKKNTSSPLPGKPSYLKMGFYLTLIINGIFEVSKPAEIEKLDEIQMKWSVKHLKVLLVRTSLNSRLFSYSPLSHLKSFIMTVVSHIGFTLASKDSPHSQHFICVCVCISIRSTFNSFIRSRESWFSCVRKQKLFRRIVLLGKLRFLVCWVDKKVSTTQ